MYAHWGDVVAAYEPVMGKKENCIDQLNNIGVDPAGVKYVLHSHLHLDHSGGVGRFPNATYVVQQREYDYAFNPDWFSKPAYIRKDFDKPGLDWKFLDHKKDDFYDLFGDGSIILIFTPGHAPGHQSFLVKLPNTGYVLLTIDAAYTMDHWNNLTLPGLVCSAVDVVDSVKKLKKIAKEKKAIVVTGHDPHAWEGFKKAPMFYYD
jgi:glyoxylase-like metal-dependent hydrolase (beta-lactamase superfamily II)